MKDARTQPRVLHINASDGEGGSGRSSYRVHTGLRDSGLWSRMFVRHKSTDDPHVAEISRGRALRSLDRRSGELLDRFSLEYMLYPSSFALVTRRWYRRANLVQLYNIHGGYFSFTALPLISRWRQVVWRLSDMWALTGHSSYSYDCERWRTGCGECPRLSDYPFPLQHDTTAFLWKAKDWTYRLSRLTIVAPSTWLASLARESPLLGRFNIHVIPNGLDTQVFRPVPKASARQSLGLDQDARILLFSADNTNQERKGGTQLLEALRTLQYGAGRDRRIHLLTAGAPPDDWDVPENVSVTHLGYIRDDLHMALVYSAADLAVVPSLAENLPNTLLEAMACGTPAVGFGSGGIPDALIHLRTGYLAKAGDVADLAKGIRTLVDDDELRLRLGEGARRHIEEEHTLRRQTERFLDLYSEVIARREPMAAAS